jgi:DNA repair exonuclease SbcCD ATPase subunit
LTVGSVRFSSIDLKYGCHDRSIKLPIRQRPIVITAPNGRGKSTLVEALVRSVFGFDSGQQHDRRVIDSRRPWRGTGMRLGIDLVDDDWATWRIDQDLVDSLMTLTSPSGQKESWRRDQAGGAAEAVTREIRERLTRLLGFADRGLYENTFCLHQGAIADTRLCKEILELAVSTYSTADAARLRLAAEAQAWQSGHPIGDEEPAEDRQSVEELEQQIADLEMSLAQAGEVDSHRVDLVARAERLERELDKMEKEIELLEEERKTLLKRREEEMEAEHLRERLLDLEGVESDLERAIADLEALEKEEAPTSEPTTVLPDDLPERARRIEELWEERKQQRMTISKKREDLHGSSNPSPLLIIAATLIALAGLPAYQVGMGTVASTLSIAGVTCMAILLVRQRGAAQNRRRIESEIELLEGQLRDVKDELSELLADLPEGENLRRERLAELVGGIEGRAGAQSKLDQARADLDAGTALTQEMLEKRSDEAIPSQPAQVLRRLQKEIIAAREDLEQKEKRQGAAAPSSDALRSSSSLEALEITIDERHKARQKIMNDLGEAQRAVTEDGRLAQSPLATRRQLDALRSKLDEVRDHQAALQRASELIDEAYDEYHGQDEQRLVDSISYTLSGLTSGELGPLLVEDGLSNPRVKLGQGEVPLECPPLGYGDYHATMLAIRLGCADFLANLGIRPPLILDEPFAHLDESRCVQLWRILNRIARDRQVIVATYNHLLLDQIGVSPDVVLDQPPAHPLFAGVA